MNNPIENEDKLVAYYMPLRWARVLSEVILLDESLEAIDKILGEEEGAAFAEKIHTGAVDASSDVCPECGNELTARWSGVGCSCGYSFCY